MIAFRLFINIPLVCSYGSLPYGYSNILRRLSHFNLNFFLVLFSPFYMHSNSQDFDDRYEYVGVLLQVYRISK